MYFIVCPFVLFLFVIVLSLLSIADFWLSPFGIFKLFIDIYVFIVNALLTSLYNSVVSNLTIYNRKNSWRVRWQFLVKLWKVFKQLVVHRLRTDFVLKAVFCSFCNIQFNHQIHLCYLNSVFIYIIIVFRGRYRQKYIKSNTVYREGGKTCRRGT